MLLLLIQYYCKFKCRIFYVNVKLTVPFTDYLGVQFKEKIRPCTVIELTYQERIRITLHCINFYVQTLVTLQKCSMFHTLISVVSLTLLSLKCRVGPSGRWVTTSPSNTELKKYTIKIAETSFHQCTVARWSYSNFLHKNTHKLKCLNSFDLLVNLADL